MDNFFGMLGLCVFVLLLMYACDPKGLGENTGIVVKAYQDATQSPRTEEKE